MTTKLFARTTDPLVFGLLFAGMSAMTADASEHHRITLKAASLPSGQLAYEIVDHKIRAADGRERDVTARYAAGPTIPGPTLVMTEGDTAEVTLRHGIAESAQPVSIHVHGVHYKIDSDGTMKSLNGVADEAAFPGKPYTYKWTAAPGTAGVWPYHDHTFGNPMLGAEDKGLFGTLIVNPASGKVPALVDGAVADLPLAERGMLAPTLKLAGSGKLSAEVEGWLKLVTKEQRAGE